MMFAVVHSQNNFKSLIKCLGVRREVHTNLVKSFNKIPGPVTIPLWGNLLQYKMGTFDFKKYHKVLEALYKQYGPIVKEKRGSRTIVHLFNPDDIKTVYLNEGPTPFIAPLMETAQFYRKQKHISLGLGNVNGNEWYRLRSSIRHLMLKPQEVQSFLPGTQKVAKDFVSHLENICTTYGRVDNLRNEVSKWALESAAITCFGKRLGSFNNGEMKNMAQKIIDANREIFQLSAALKFSLPLYKLVQTPKWKKIQEAEDFVYRKTEEYVEETMEHLKGLLSKSNESDRNYQFMMYLMSKDTLSKQDVIIIIFSLFTDGLSTTVPALIYNLYCLATNPDVQDKAYNEIDTSLGQTETVTAGVLNKLSYIKAILKETFRLYPIGTEVSRILQKGLVLSGYQVPQGTQVDLTPNVNFKSEKYFKNAEMYVPERWLRGSEGENNNPYLLTPFGHGTRTCAGRRFAEQDLYTVLIYILQRFKLEYTSNSKPLEQVFETLLFPDGPVDIIFKPR